MRAARVSDTSVMPGLKLRREPAIVPKLNAFPYQTDAVEAIKDLEYAAVFHEQGLGKTKIAIDVLLYWLKAQVVDTVFLITKKTLLDNWQRELHTHTFLKPRLLTLSGANNFHLFNSPVRLILTHFEAVKKEQSRISLFARTRRLGVIIDESARLKNPSAALTRAFMDLAPSFQRRVIMTGTPVANRPEDLWAQIWFLDQGASLGSDFRHFKNTVNINALAFDESRNALTSELDALFPRIQNFTVRETKDTVGIELPNKFVHPVWCDWEHYQYDLYERVRNELEAIIMQDGLPTKDDAELILKRLLRLVQVASNPSLLDPGYRALPGKLANLLDILYAIHDKGEKAIVWTAFTQNVDWLTTALAEFGPRRIHGRLPIDARNRAIHAFTEDPLVELLVATPASAKEGLTLTAANHVIFFDRTFSLDDYLQAQDRIHRISQEKACYVYNLLMRDSIDEWIDVLLSAKRSAAQLVQSDIDKERFQSEMRFDFRQVLRGILGTV